VPRPRRPRPDTSVSGADRRIVLGRISGIYGVRGWVRVFSYTEPRQAILEHDPWELEVDGRWREVHLEGGRPHGKGIVAKLAGWDDRDEARRLIGATIAIPRDRLPPLPEGEYYWADLIGLRVFDQDGRELGRVETLMETGAHDVLVVKDEAGNETLVPYVQGPVVKAIDLDAGRMDVEWWPPE